MKNILGILFLFVLLIISCSIKTTITHQKNDISGNGLNGNVKFTKSELYNLIAVKDTFKIGEKIDGFSIDRNSLTEYNQFGKYISSKEFLLNGKLINEIKYSYDQNNRLVRKKEIDYYGKESYVDYEFILNKSDSIVQIIISHDSLIGLQIMERDNKNRLKRIQIFQNNTISGSYTYEYDQNDNIISENVFIRNDIPYKLLKRTFNQYNLKTKEQIINYTSYGDTLYYQNKFFYNFNQNLVREEWNIGFDLPSTVIKHKYFKNEVLKESKTIMKRDEFITTQTREYDQFGNLIRDFNERNNTDNVWNYIYKYDSKNNWVEKLEFMNGKPLRAVKRQIEYYK